MVSPFDPFLNEAGVVILDGGLATELERRGADLCDPLWSAKLLVDDPDLIRQVHEDYFRAGADVGTSASYQASYLGFAGRGLSPAAARDRMRLSVRLVREARDQVALEPGRRTPIVAASIGCYGAMLADGSEYRGVYDLNADDLFNWHRPRMETLLDEAPDILACETIPCLAEAHALARLIGDIGHPAWISFCCRDGATLSSGEPFAAAVDVVVGVKGVVAVGVNCTAPEHMPSLIEIARQRTSKSIVVYPNRGGVWNESTRRWETPIDALDWGSAGRRWTSAGASVVGGCCRTTPDDVRALRASLS